jgi:hypothetical protein
MRWLFCWRCGCDMPMLDEAEFAEVEPLYRSGVWLVKQEQADQAMRGTTLSERFQPLLDAYERLTGFRETNANAVMHHRLALYGLPCVQCGKPLRTPRASRCMACGADRHAEPGAASERGGIQ